jgi:DNA-binding transcriptional MerR regulator
MSPQPRIVSESTSSLLSIGEVLARLRKEFDDVSISKIRFLEANGLIAPARTPSGYRKFSLVDVERLRYILRMQRDYFLPLKVIREHIDAMDRGLEPPSVSDSTPKPPRALESTESLNSSEQIAAVRLTAVELAKAADVSVEYIMELAEFGIAVADSQGFFDGLALNIASVSKTLSNFGLEPRHLKTVLQSASREVDLFSPIVKSAKTGKNPASNVQAKELEMQLATSVVRLHELLVRNIITK